MSVKLKYCSEDCKRLAYIALVRSILEYGAVVWDPYQSRDIIAVEKVQRQAARFIKNDYKSSFEGCVKSMLEDLKLPILQQRRLETRLVMLYKTVQGMVPAINADEFLIPIRNKRHIKPRVQSDFHTTNIVEKFSTNHSECFKIPDSHTEQYKNLFFVRTVSGTNWRRVTSAQRQLTASEKLSISATNFIKRTHRGCRCRIGFYC